MSAERGQSVELRPDAVRAWLQLNRLLAEAVDDGRTVPCVVDPDPYTSDDRAERTEAAAACSPCPVLVECGRFALANRERRWVWAGVDITPRHGNPATVGPANAAARAELEARGGSDPRPDTPGTAALSLPLSPEAEVRPETRHAKRDVTPGDAA